MDKDKKNIKEAQKNTAENKQKKFSGKTKEIIMYLIFGVATTLVRWITQWVFTSIFENALPKEEITIWFLKYDSTGVFVATLLSWLAAVIFAFVTNKLWVFESKSWKPSIAIKELWQFFLSRAITGVIEIVGVFLLVGVGVDQLVIPKESMDATILMSGIIMVLNYVLSKLIVFKEKDPEKEKMKKEKNKIKKERKRLDKIEKQLDDKIKDINK